ncbi:MAG: hypothetical protein J0L73_08215 [Verrucomicrobia bacterium]|nr:hypothetical protein [Verrucomicrobiota bacterium]
MSEELTPPMRNRQPHYSFMRPGEFGMLMFFLAFTAWKFWSAFGLAKPYFMEWITYAVVSLVITIWYGWIRSKRRHCCDDAGELLITLILPQAYSMAWKHCHASDNRLDWPLFWVYAALLVVMAYRVWQAPRIAKELEEIRAMLEPTRPRFTHIETP